MASQLKSRVRPNVNRAFAATLIWTFANPRSLQFGIANLIISSRSFRFIVKKNRGWGTRLYKRVQANLARMQIFPLSPPPFFLRPHRPSLLSLRTAVHRGIDAGTGGCLDCRAVRHATKDRSVTLSVHYHHLAPMHGCASAFLAHANIVSASKLTSAVPHMTVTIHNF